MSAEGLPRLRIGGMAIGNGVLMRGPRYWAWAAEGKDVAYGPVRSLLNRHRFLRLPLVRSLVVLAEMFALMIRIHRRNGVRNGARLLAVLLAVMGSDLFFGALIPLVVHSAVLANVLVVVLVFAVGLGALRLGLGKAVWRYHGAEHKAVNAYEAGVDLHDVDAVARCSRVHTRCGTNLAVIVLLMTVLSYFVLESLPLLPGAVCVLLTLMVSLEFFRVIGRRPNSFAARTLLAGGRMLQRRVTTSEPAPEHLQLACASLCRVLELEAGPVP